MVPTTVAAIDEGVMPPFVFIVCWERSSLTVVFEGVVCSG